MSKSNQPRGRGLSPKWKAIVKKWAQLLFNPRFLLCFGIGWMITNGWAYVMFGVGAYFDIQWACAVSGAYLTLLWIPMTPEKIITVAIAILLLRWLFPNDEKTLGVLREMQTNAKRVISKQKKKASSAVCRRRCETE